jgi:hypothetical protein
MMVLFDTALRWQDFLWIGVTVFFVGAFLTWLTIVINN